MEVVASIFCSACGGSRIDRGVSSDRDGGGDPAGGRADRLRPDVSLVCLTHHPRYAISQRIRKSVEEAFGWAKTVAGLRKMRHRGLQGRLAIRSCHGRLRPCPIVQFSRPTRLRCAVRRYALRRAFARRQRRLLITYCSRGLRIAYIPSTLQLFWSAIQCLTVPRTRAIFRLIISNSP
jgi:hypothetical protein